MAHSHIRLGVNIDHVATLRAVRGTPYPDLCAAAAVAIDAGADAITVHLREDRRHIQDEDVFALRSAIAVPLNLEIAATVEMRDIALQVAPAVCCIVPERREELTTEGGLDVCAHEAALTRLCTALAAGGIEVSLFVDPVARQIAAAARTGAPTIELHTGRYAGSTAAAARGSELAAIAAAAAQAAKLGLRVNAGHGLHYDNVAAIAALGEIHELNIGHAIVARAVFDGLERAVSAMRERMLAARR